MSINKVAFQPSLVLQKLSGTYVRHVDYRKVVSSTMDVAKEHARAGRWGVVVLADEQTHGRGRQGRVWNSPPGKNLVFSVSLEVPLSKYPLLSLLTGLSVRDAIVGLFPGLGPRLKIKWPNDLLFEGLKVCGVLVEGTTGHDTARVVVGVGINMNMSRKEINEIPKISKSATSLAVALGREVDCNHLLIAFFVAHDRWLSRIGSSEGRRGLIRAINEHHFLTGRQVQITMPGINTLAGQVVGIGPDGALQVQTPSGLELITSGEAHVISSPSSPSQTGRGSQTGWPPA